MPMVKFINRQYQIVSPPGTSHVLYGQRYIVQPNGELHCDMHEDYIPSEVASGRVEVLPGFEPVIIVEPPAQTKQIDLSDEFPGDASDYFGYKSLEAFSEKIRSLKKSDLSEFCQKLIGVNITYDMGKSTIIHRAINTVDSLAKSSREEA